ncbi:uncharacterized protein Tco025E_09433 [Trypanosoma conorhini]|uniref:Mucin-associated surface protein (MASP) n=1 Tax=Trypanosoma conorhini TaxID=83891 RepID=A0A3R7R7Y8_9TRYP|nr:uncharacterized protein Tco025E_09433 [Trypanosoma conorhini]RNE97518.1 hypothetical protein Tco025E_09433 [Trypanosoma conorhini]
MVGRALLVCALCALCCAAGGGWAAEGDYCTERDWRDLRAVAKDMSEAEIAAKYCGRKPELVRGLRASLQSGGEAEAGGASGPGGGGGGVEGVADGGPARPAEAKVREYNPQAETHSAEVLGAGEATGPPGGPGGLGRSPSREKELSPLPSGETEEQPPSGASTGGKAAEGQLGTSPDGPSDVATPPGQINTQKNLQEPTPALPSTGPEAQKREHEGKDETNLHTPEGGPPKRADASAKEDVDDTHITENTPGGNDQEANEIAPSQSRDGGAVTSLQSSDSSAGTSTDGREEAPTERQPEGSSTLTKPPTPASTEVPGEAGKETTLGKPPSKGKDVEESLASDNKADGGDEKAKPEEAVPAPTVTSNTPDGRAVDAALPTAHPGGGGTSGEQAGNKAEAIAELSAGSVAAAAPGAQQQGVAAAGTPTSSDKEPPPKAEDTATEASPAAMTTDGGSGSTAAQPQPASSVVANEAGQPQQKEHPAVPTSQSQAETSGDGEGEATQPAAGAAAQTAANTTNSTNAAKAAPGDSDGSGTAAAHSASPLALLLLLACAAAAVMRVA